MNTGELHPGRGIGLFRFGLPRAEARALLHGFKLSTYQKEPENDFFPEAGLILGYDAGDLLEYVEVAEPSEVTFSGEGLIGLGLLPALACLKATGELPRRDGSSFYFDKLCVVLFAPEGSLGSVAIYREGYYER